MENPLFEDVLCISYWTLGFSIAMLVSNRATPPKTNMDTQKDGLEKVTPLKNDNFWYLC